MAPQDLENCGRDFAKLKQSDAKFAGTILLRMVIIDGVINTILGGLTLDPAGMHCPSWDDAFVSSFSFFYVGKIFLHECKSVSRVLRVVSVRSDRLAHHSGNNFRVSSLLSSTPKNRLSVS